MYKPLLLQSPGLGGRTLASTKERRIPGARADIRELRVGEEPSRTFGPLSLIRSEPAGASVFAIALVQLQRDGRSRVVDLAGDADPFAVQDGERLVVPTRLMDSSFSQPGYVTLTDVADQQRVEDAYAAMRERITHAWKHDRRPTPLADGTDADQRVEAAYAARNERLRTAWKDAR